MQLEGGVSDDGVMGEFGGRFEVVITEGSFNGRLQGKVSEEDRWVGFDLIYIIVTGVGLSVRLSVRCVSLSLKHPSHQFISTLSTDLESL